MGNKPTLSDILNEFQAVRTKTAEEAPIPTPAEENYVPQQPETEPYVGEEPEQNVTANDLQTAADTVQQADTQAVSAAQQLRNIADEYIDQHSDAIQKEAALFGEIFAKTAMESINNQQWYDAILNEAYIKTASFLEDNYFNDQLDATSEDAYDLVMCKMAEEEAYNIANQAVNPDELAAMQQQAEQEQDAALDDNDEIPDWLQKSIKDTTSTLGEHVNTLNSLVEAKERRAEQEQAAADQQAQMQDAAANAYQAASQALPPQQQQQVDPAQMQAAAANAYQAADQALPPQQPQQPPLQ